MKSFIVLLVFSLLTTPQFLPAQGFARGALARDVLPSEVLPGDVLPSEVSSDSASTREVFSGSGLSPSVAKLLPNSQSGLFHKRIKHHIFFIHGLGGNEASFGKMPSYLRIHLNNLQSIYDYETHIFTYATWDDKPNTTDFAIDFSNFIQKTVEQEKGPYKISIIAHSQGGVVTTIWYYHLLIGDLRFNLGQENYLHTVITLGTPFWGSKLAHLASKEDNGWIWWLKEQIPDKLGPLSNIGKTQLLDMSFGSDVLQDFRRNLWQIAPQLRASKLSNVRFLNVSGNANLKRLTEERLQEKSSWFTHLLPFVFGTIEYESDGAVLIPSSTINTLYHRSIVNDYEEGVSPIRSTPDEIGFADRLFVKTLHASSDPEMISDLSFVPELCYNLSSCEHPVYPFVVDYFLGKDIPLYADNIKYHNFGGFTLELNVRLPPGFKQLRDQVKVFVDPECLKNETKDDYTVYTRIGADIEIQSSAMALSKRYKDSVSFWFTGHMFRKGDNVTAVNRERPLPLESKEIALIIRAPGMKERRIKVKVQPTLSSFADVNLVPRL